MSWAISRSVSALVAVSGVLSVGCASGFDTAAPALPVAEPNGRLTIENHQVVPDGYRLVRAHYRLDGVKFYEHSGASAHPRTVFDGNITWGVHELWIELAYQAKSKEGSRSREIITMTASQRVEVSNARARICVQTTKNDVSTRDVAGFRVTATDCRLLGELLRDPGR